MSDPQPKLDPNRALFDAHAETYSGEIERAFGSLAKEHDFFVRHKAETIARILDRERPGERHRMRLLDVGCGTGLTHRYLVNEVGALDGVDVSEDSLSQARTANPNVRYFRSDSSVLPFAGAEYDCAVLVCVLHHVPVSERATFLGEVARVLKPESLFIVIEHNPFNPATRWVVGRCCLDEDAVLLRAAELAASLQGAGFAVLRSSYMLFTPFRGRLFRCLDDWLAWLPLGAQHVTTAKRP